MSAGPKLLVIAGMIMIVVGIVWQVGGRFLHLGRLPGDIVVEKENFKFYFPVVTCLILSVLGSLILYLFRFFGK